MLKTPETRIVIRLVIAVIAVMSGLAIIWFGAYRTPDLQAQVQTAQAALELTRRSLTVDYSADDITVSPYDTDEVEARKVLFLARMLPLIVAENDRILAQRSMAQRTTSPAQLNRSEEHTSELQSPMGKVCRHLLARPLEQ